MCTWLPVACSGPTALANDRAGSIIEARDDAQGARHKLSGTDHILWCGAASALHQFSEIIDLPAALALDLAFHLAH
jgi:hypothetical protein